MNQLEENIEKKVTGLVCDFMTMAKMEISQIKKNSESEMTGLRDSLTFLSLMKDEFVREIENKKKELLQAHGTKKNEENLKEE